MAIDGLGRSDRGVRRESISHDYVPRVQARDPDLSTSSWCLAHDLTAEYRCGFEHRTRQTGILAFGGAKGAVGPPRPTRRESPLNRHAEDLSWVGLMRRASAVRQTWRPAPRSGLRDWLFIGEKSWWRSKIGRGVGPPPCIPPCIPPRR